tara:strand:- start:150 stop:512 length:363 start_codon:yes stop_codon:yes gene_type:complete
MRPKTEGKGLSERRPSSNQIFQYIETIFELAQPRDAKGVRHPVQIKAGQLGQGDIFIGVGIRRPGDDFNVMSQGLQLARHMAGINTLTPGVGMTSISQKGDTEWTLAGHLTLSQLPENEV